MKHLLSLRADEDVFSFHNPHHDAHNNNVNGVIGMDKKKKARGTHGEFPMHDDMCLSGTASTSDCTGLVPEGSVDSADEYERINELRRCGANRKKQ